MGDVYPIEPARRDQLPHSGNEAFLLKKLHDYIELTETEAEYVLTIELSAFGLINVDVTLAKSSLHINAHWKPTVRVAGTRRARTRSRISRPSWERAFVLPGDVLRQDIHASYGNGVLTVRLPRDPSHRLPREIEVTMAGCPKSSRR